MSTETAALSPGCHNHPVHVTAISCRDENGASFLGVHRAYVVHQVPAGSKEKLSGMLSIAVSAWQQKSFEPDLSGF